MAKKFLKATFQNRCIGCELCVFEVQRQLGKVGLTDSPIRILKDDTGGKMHFHVELDERVDKLNILEVFKVCPTLVFEIVEVENENQYIN